MFQEVYEFAMKGQGGVPGLAHRAFLLLRAVAGLEKPFPLFQGVAVALDLQAEATNIGEPDGEVDLGRIVVPLPFVAGEAG